MKQINTFLVICTTLFITPATGETLPPLGGEDLKRWLQAGDYRSWKSESVIHDSEGPHFGRVRAFLNPTLFDSMTKENDEHPVGSVAVKELYESGDTVKGWAVAIKTTLQAGGGSNWYWYESYKNETIKDGQGEFLCKACHFTGNDYVLTPFPMQ